MRTEQEIKDKIKIVERYQYEAKENMGKARFHQWEVVVTYLKWTIAENKTNGN